MAPARASLVADRIHDVVIRHTIQSKCFSPWCEDHIATFLTEPWDCEYRKHLGYLLSTG